MDLDTLAFMVQLRNPIIYLFYRRLRKWRYRIWRDM
jgi:hypothetical protein